MAKFAVLLPAAGRSERFGGEKKKPWRHLDGRPIFIRSIEAFLGRSDVGQVILIVHPDDVEYVKTAYGANLVFMGVKLAEGGDRRRESVAHGLRAVAEEIDFVAIHDAVRPCVTPEMIEAVFAEAIKSGAAILGCPVASTLKRADASMTIEATVSREGLYEAQTPQVFRKQWLLDAHAQADPADDSITDDAQLVERLGHPVKIVPSDASNLKITTPSDLKLAEAILKTRPPKPTPRLGVYEEAQW